MALFVLRHIKNFIYHKTEELYKYVPFKRFIPLDTFRYAVCGGANTAFDIFLYFISYNFILRKQIINLILFKMTPHIGAFVMSFSISFPTGFLLAKYITFKESELRGRVQLFRYGLTVFVCIVLNYVLIKFFVEYFNIFPTVAKTLTTCVVIIYSYLSQKHFSFKIHKKAFN